MAAITHVGDRLLVIRGKMRGWTGEVKAIKHLQFGLIDYEMEFDDDSSIILDIPADDCREYNPGTLNLESPFDITNYLPVNQMKDIAETVYTTKITDYINDIINNQKIAGRNFLERVIDEIIRSFAKEYLDQYKDQLLETFKKVIEMDVPAVNDEDMKCFGRSIQWALERCATKYIEEHPDEITEIMKDGIHANAKRMIDEKWSWSMQNTIKQVADKLVNEAFNINNK